MNASWALVFSIGLLESKNLFDIFRVGIPNVLAGRAAGLITALYIFGITDIILGIKFFTGATADPFLLSFAAFTAIVISIFWWKVFFVGVKFEPLQQRLNPILWVLFLAVCALAVFQSKHALWLK